MVKVAGSSDGDYKIQQGVRQGNINKHIHPVINCADNHQENGGLGAYHIDTHNPVNGCRALDSPVQSQKNQKTEGNAYTDKKRIHFSLFQKRLTAVLPFHPAGRQLPCG
jgi:hypothetical protein